MTIHKGRCLKDHSHDPEDWNCQAFMPGECMSCDWPTTELKQYDNCGDRGPGGHVQSYMWICKVCASTAAGNAYQYPRQYPDHQVLKFLAWQTNYLAALIKGEEVTKLGGE